MLSPTFASAYNDVKHKEPGRVVLTLMPQFFDKLEQLNIWLTDTDNDVSPGVRRIASNPVEWKRLVLKSKKHNAARTSPSARRRVGESIAARVLREPDFDKLPNAPRMDDGRINFNALLKARAAAAWVGMIQLKLRQGPKPVVIPRINIKNMVPSFNRDRGTLRIWLQYATDFGLIECHKKPTKGNEGEWTVTPLVKGVDAPLTSTETAVAAALAGITDEVLADGIWENFAADLILNVGHDYWHQKPGKLGPVEWWTLLQLHTGAPRKSDEEEALYACFTSIADLDAAVTPEAREARKVRDAAREVERAERAKTTREKREKDARVWKNLREKLGWNDVTEDTLVEWAAVTRARLTYAPEETANDIRAQLALSLPRKWSRSINLTAALAELSNVTADRVELNLRSKLGWLDVTEPQLVEWTQSTILRLASAPLDLASSIRSTLVTAIPYRYPPSENVSAALNLLEGAA